MIHDIPSGQKAWPESFMTTGVGYPAEKAVESGMERVAAVVDAAHQELNALRATELRE